MSFGIPGFGFFSQSGLYAQERAELQQSSNTLVGQCNEVEALKDIAAYLQLRAREESLFDNNEQLSARNALVEQLLNGQNNLQSLRDLLQEDKIKPFKGFFTQRFYNLLVNYRQSLESPSVEQSTAMTP